MARFTRQLYILLSLFFEIARFIVTRQLYPLSCVNCTHINTARDGMKLLRETSKISCRFVLGSEAHILVSPPPLKNNILVLASTTTKSCMYTTHSTGYNMVSEAQVQSYVRTGAAKSKPALKVHAIGTTNQASAWKCINTPREHEFSSWVNTRCENLFTNGTIVARKNIHGMDDRRLSGKSHPYGFVFLFGTNFLFHEKHNEQAPIRALAFPLNSADVGSRCCSSFQSI